jgi:hypothetical protein
MFRPISAFDDVARSGSELRRVGQSQGHRFAASSPSFLL